MKNMIRAAAVSAALTVAGVALTGVASAAEDTSYVPDTCTETVNGVEIVVDCSNPEVAGKVQAPAAEAVAVASAGTLPYTGSDSSLPLAEAGVALVAGGGALLLVVKRRQAATNT